MPLRGWTMRPLQRLLAVNGAVFLLRSTLNLVNPRSFYLETDAPGYAVDAVRVLGVTYGAFGIIQLGAWRSVDHRAVRTTAVASMLFGLGVGAQATTQGSESADTFHRMRHASALENIALAALYGYLLVREPRSA